MPSKSKSGINIQFFWERNSRSTSKSRFNLLLLEFGELLMEDLSAYFFPIPTSDLSQAFDVQDALKIQGRLKLSSRSLIFEPNDRRVPIMKFPYKTMIAELEQFNLKHVEKSQLSVDVSGFFTFPCRSYLEMKANDKIGPYKLVEFPSSPTPGQVSTASRTDGHRVVIALVHADLAQFLVKVEQLRNIQAIAQKQGSGMANHLLKPFIEAAQLWNLNFNTNQLVDFHEELLLPQAIAVKRVQPLRVNPGSLMVTGMRIYFQPSQLNNTGDSVQHLEIRKVVRVFKRRHLLRHLGLELLMMDGSSHLFVMDTVTERDSVFDLICNQPALPAAARRRQDDSVGEITARWQRREISNFEYLMQLNNEADRSLNDLTQYPVFPHIIADFTSRKLDLTSPNTFRDLTRPMGALNAERLQYFKERYHNMPPADPDMSIPPPFLYGTHYSTPGYVLHYLVRLAPEEMLNLQNGKFDSPDRMFQSIAATWNSCLTNPTDLKELIPEFFVGTGEYLTNFNDLDLGHLHTGERLNDVELPPWADSPRDFIRKNAKALESDYVSENLHHWIDLIFGYKQRGEAAIKADNLYYYLTYEGAVDLEQISDARQRDALVLQIQEFGQTPRQLFTSRHPARYSRVDSAYSRRNEASNCRNFTESSGQNSGDGVSGGVPEGSGNLSGAASPSSSLNEQQQQNSQTLEKGGSASIDKATPQREGTGGSGVEDEDDGVEIGLVDLDLDEEFKRQVALELLLSNSRDIPGVDNVNITDDKLRRNNGSHSSHSMRVIPGPVTPSSSKYNSTTSNGSGLTLAQLHAPQPQRQQNLQQRNQSSPPDSSPPTTLFGSVINWTKSTASYLDERFKLGTTTDTSSNGTPSVANSSGKYSGGSNNSAQKRW